MTHPTPDNTTQGDELDEIVQQMLVDYTAWVNGEPTPWNVKKTEAKQKLLAWREKAIKQAVADAKAVIGTPPYIASPELCVELYKRSGWGRKELLVTLSPELEETPHYTLAYLMRKLPRFTSISKLPDQQAIDNPMPYSAWHHDHQVYADTPENAVAKLCIELFKNNILKRGNYDKSE